MEKEELSKYERARQKVAKIKGFYNHLAIYIIANTALFLLSGKFNFVLISLDALNNPDFGDWFDWNYYGTPIIWGIVLVCHGLKVFGGFRVFGKQWEARQMAKFLKEDKMQ